MLTIKLNDDTVISCPEKFPLKNLKPNYPQLPFGCLKAQCGKCMVEVVSGDLVEISDLEFRFFKHIGIKPGKLRLMCQSILKSNCILKI